MTFLLTQRPLRWGWQNETPSGHSLHREADKALGVGGLWNGITNDELGVGILNDDGVAGAGVPGLEVAGYLDGVGGVAAAGATWDGEGEIIAGETAGGQLGGIGGDIRGEAEGLFDQVWQAVSREHGRIAAVGAAPVGECGRNLAAEREIPCQRVFEHV